MRNIPICLSVTFAFKHKFYLNTQESLCFPKIHTLFTNLAALYGFAFKYIHFLYDHSIKNLRLVRPAARNFTTLVTLVVARHVHTLECVVDPSVV